MLIKKIDTIKRVLQTIAIAHIVGGFCFPWIVQSELFSAYHEHLQRAFNVNAENYGENYAKNNGANAAQQATFLMAIFGPTIASWGILFLFAVNSGFARPTPQAWWFMFAACVAWAPYDSIFSLQHGVYLNAIINGIAFPVIVGPLLLVKKHFTFSHCCPTNSA